MEQNPPFHRLMICKIREYKGLVKSQFPPEEKKIHFLRRIFFSWGEFKSRPVIYT